MNVARLLIEREANVNAKNRDERTALHKCAANGNLIIFLNISIGKIFLLIFISFTMQDKQILPDYLSNVALISMLKIMMDLLHCTSLVKTVLIK